MDVEKKSALDGAREAISVLPVPGSLFAGLQLSASFVPDNIILFRRTHTRALAPEGVSNNYHHRFVLMTVLSHGGQVRIGNHSHVLEPGEAVLIFPNQFHHYMDVARGELEWLFITFDCAHSDVLKPLLDMPRVLNAASLQRIQLITEIYMRTQRSGKETLMLSHALGSLLLEMCGLSLIPAERLNTHSADDARDVLMERINAYVRANLHRKLTLADLAEALGYSVSHLRTVFRDRLGVSLGRYIRESQLSEAAKLLLHSDLSVTEIAQRTSFQSLFAFSRAFKSAYGMPPKTYSKMLGRE